MATVNCKVFSQAQIDDLNTKLPAHAKIIPDPHPLTPGFWIFPLDMATEVVTAYGLTTDTSWVQASVRPLDLSIDPTVSGDLLPQTDLNTGNKTLHYKAPAANKIGAVLLPDGATWQFQPGRYSIELKILARTFGSGEMPSPETNLVPLKTKKGLALMAGEQYFLAPGDVETPTVVVLDFTIISTQNEAIMIQTDPTYTATGSWISVRGSYKITKEA